MDTPRSARALLVALALWLLPALAAGKPRVFKAARLFDGKSDALAVPGVVVVDGDRVVAAGPRTAVPDGAEVIDLGDATLMPGLMDAHTHLTGELSDDWNRDELDGFKKTIPEQAFDTVAWARRTIEAGFTTVRDLASHDFLDVGLRNAIRAGKLTGPRMLVAVHALSSRGGHCDITAGYRAGLLPEPGPADGVVAGPDQARDAVRFNAKHGADVIKVCASGGVLSLVDKVDSPQLTQAELDAIVDEAHALGRRAAAHAHGSEAARRAVMAGIDSIEHGTFLTDDVLQLMKQKGTALVVTPLPCMEENLKKAGAPEAVQQKAAAAAAKVADLFARAQKAGVTIAFGTDACVCPHGTQWRQMVYMVEHGMKPLAVLRSATSVDANLLGLGDRLGTLEPGRTADLVAVRGDPTQDMAKMRSVVLVVKAGEVIVNVVNEKR